MASTPHRSVVDWLASLVGWSQRRRLTLIGLTWFGYLVLNLVVADPSVAPLSTIPVLVTGWAFGRFAGLIAAAASVPLHIFLPWIYGYSDGLFWAQTLASGVVVLFFVGAAAGALRWLADRVLAEFRTRQRAFEELEASELRYRSLHDGLPVGIYRTTPEGRILDANRALADMLGYETADALKELNAVDMYVDPEERATTQRSPDVGKVRTGVEVRLRHTDGSVVWVRDSSRPVYDDRGEVIHSDGILEDITEQRKSRMARFAADERFREAFDRSPIGMALSTLDGALQRVNPAFGEMLGYEPDELVRKTVADVTHPDDLAETGDAYEKLVAGELPHFRMNKRCVHRDGHDVWVLVNVSPVIGPSGETEQLLAQIVDVSELIEAEERLERLVKSKDEFVATVSHELRTPLTAVHGFASELQQRWGEFTDEEAADLVKLIAAQSAEVANLVEDLLVAARAEIGQLVVVPEPTEFAGEARHVLDSLPEQIRDRVSKIEGSGVGLADPVRLRQIVRNLLTNADRYGGDEIRIEVGRRSDRMVLSVSDNGPGISEDQREMIFEPYRRVHFSQGRLTGVGLGLTVSRRLARLMEGDLTYEFVDGWSSFELALPADGYHAPADWPALDSARR